MQYTHTESDLAVSFRPILRRLLLAHQARLLAAELSHKIEASMSSECMGSLLFTVDSTPSGCVCVCVSVCVCLFVVVNTCRGSGL